MKKEITRFIICFILSQIVFSTSLCQKNPVLKILSKNNQLAQELKEIGISGHMAEWFSVMGYGQNTIKELKKSGIDIVKNLHRFNARDERTKTVLSDCIIIGTVTKIEYDTGNFPYRTRAYLAVEKYLRNDYQQSEKTIQVLIESGPVTEKVWADVNHEDRLQQGEHVLLFLSASTLIMNTKYNNPEYYELLTKDSLIKFEIQGNKNSKYLIEDDYAILGRNKLKLSDIEDQIHSTLKVIDKSRSKN